MGRGIIDAFLEQIGEVASTTVITSPFRGVEQKYPYFFLLLSSNHRQELCLGTGIVCNFNRGWEKTHLSIAYDHWNGYAK
jgi:hypothetical protein